MVAFDFNETHGGKFENPYCKSSFRIVVISKMELHLPTIFLVIPVIFLKKDQDLLQGVSKLDNLLKVSAFQKYK